VRFVRDTAAMTATEVALFMPVMLTLLLGVVDLGNAMLLDKKTMTAAMVSSDLLTRRATVTMAEVTDAYAAGRMAVQPYNGNDLGMDVVSIRFEGASPSPVIVWRETFNMVENPDVLTIVDGLGVSGEGVLVITTQYDFDPLFLHGVVDQRAIQEVAITRPRRGSFIALE